MTKIMAILNVTDDSFYSPSRVLDPTKAIERALLLQEEGADIIDIGAESSRPGALPISEKEELARLLPVLQGLKGTLSIPISIDTTKPAVAKAALLEGVQMINDISGFQDPGMRAVVSKSRALVCVMHMKGTPATMQQHTDYPEGVVYETKEWLDKQTRLLLHDGIEPERIIIDPGIGFGKSMQDNFAILKNIKEYQELGFPILVGASRKSFLSKYLQRPTDELLAATLAVSAYLAFCNIDYVRVHDVRAHRDALNVIQACGISSFKLPKTGQKSISFQ
jgi:dihydropteroate synthase